MPQPGLSPEPGRPHLKLATTDVCIEISYVFTLNVLVFFYEAILSLCVTGRNPILEKALALPWILKYYCFMVCVELPECD